MKNRSTTRRTMMGRTAGVFGAMLGGAAAAACGPTGQPGAPQAAKEPVTIRVVARQAQEADMWPIRLPAFEEKYPNITVQPELSAGNIREKINTEVAAGTIGDVVHTHPSAAQPQILYLGGSMRALDDLIAKDKIKLDQWFQVAVDAGRLDGKVISLPFKGKMGRIAFYFNVTLFEQAGLQPPNNSWTVDQVMEAAAKLTTGTGETKQWGLATHLPKGQSTFTASVRRWNAETYDKTMLKCLLDSAQAQESCQWYYDMYHKRRVADPAGSESKIFLAGRGAMWFNTDYNRKTSIHPAAEQQGFKYSAALAPKGPTGRRGGMWISDAMQISTITQHPEEAWKLLLWLTNKETGLALAQQTSAGVSTTPGARPDVYNDPKFLDHPVYPRLLQELDRDAT
ncbi:MAG: ABC transporter substrate-binding protein, partial [Chloroflexota bacterium]